MKQLGLTTGLVQVVDDRPTGVAQVAQDIDGDPCFEIPRPAAFDRVSMTPDLRSAVAMFSAGMVVLRHLAPDPASYPEDDRGACAELPGSAAFMT